MKQRQHVVDALARDVCLSLHSLDHAHGATGDEGVTAVMSSLMGFVLNRTTDEEHYRAVVKQVADAMVRSLDDQHVQRVAVTQQAVQ
jgi:hypothetical protein